ncbi:Mn(2+) uptake NRAMP transporter MntH [Lactococcus raffinolactis]|jgi:manganese transport protein|uniref:Nramp family divalent metal transporter n=1 Tax=Pseudolactococcus raffinolactis TaxID=1366 RepID=UPI001436BC35|nr:Nramp family divalent metal transporter [Lactococcus raffinolactis]MDN5413386.1 Nramp family divalent metal transporter [Lactococcus raffinolactis]MDN5472134.1 Nramp family divalent metal transporter [Lactococcus raffinolactis]MDN5493923.1 Nramp family divalent metal transporter [Lactococcus raffinolactis]MDN5579106.1 Nramp family divalent metal transporter [Lactococcus raffinolactis]MDN6036265.1 Nramp family divalent metal transporter [Lactococcus raffinolactis]
MKEHKKFVKYANGPSLAEINGTVEIPKNNSFWKNILAFSGPGALVAVGYMDPGNWITSIGGGAQYGYLLLSVVLVSSLIAMLLQYMASKLGIVTGLDLAQATRKHTGRKLGFVLWIITELAIMATDIAEVIGGAIALNLLFGLPIIWGVILTVFDVLLLLFLMKLGFRKIEAIVITLISVIMIVFVYEVAISDPVIADMLKGFIPQKEIFDRSQLTMALGIVGATVMPHNLYLHSSIAQTRNYNRQDEDDVARAVRFSTWDSNIQLTVAFIINTLLLVLGAAMFFGRGEGLGTFTSLYNALQDNKLAGAIASPVLSTLFAVALLASGQNSTITGTLSGQIVMEGFINLKMPTWARRLITRGLSVIPVLIAAIYYHGREGGLDTLMIQSQVFLSIALPVSMIPLVYFTSNEKIMGKRFRNNKVIAALGWIAAIALTILNIKLIVDMFH